MTKKWERQKSEDGKPAMRIATQRSRRNEGYGKGDEKTKKWTRRLEIRNQKAGMERQQWIEKKKNKAIIGRHQKCKMKTAKNAATKLLRQKVVWGNRHKSFLGRSCGGKGEKHVTTKCSEKKQQNGLDKNIETRRRRKENTKLNLELKHGEKRMTKKTYKEESAKKRRR